MSNQGKGNKYTEGWIAVKNITNGMVVLDNNEKVKVKIPEIYNILKKGSEAAREVAAQTLSEVKNAMRINYFNDLELIKAQSEKYSKHE